MIARTPPGQNTPPQTPDVLFSEAVKHHQAGRLRDAADFYNRVLKARPRHSDAIHLLGVLAHQCGEHVQAIELISRAIAIAPNAAIFHSNLGHAVAASGKLADAITHHRKAVTLEPRSPDFHCNLANALHLLRQHEEAVNEYREALTLQPENVMASTNLGISLGELGRLEDAAVAWRKGLETAPDDPDLHRNLGIALQQIGSLDEALSHCERAAGLAPDTADAQINLGNALQKLRRHREAIPCFERALSLAPDNDVAYNNLANSLMELRRGQDAVECFEKAISLAPNNPEYHNNLGGLFHKLRRQDEALDHFEKALSIAPHHPNALSQSIFLKREMCDWDGIEERENIFIDVLRTTNTPVPPFTNLSVIDDPALQLSCAKRFIEARTTPPQSAAAATIPETREKLRIGYFGGTFRTHPVAFLMAQLPELHDRSKYEIQAFSYGRTDGSPLRQRLESTFDEFHDVEKFTDAEIVNKIRSAEIDILVDLDGYTDGARIDLLSHRPAPIQAHYLGYPGTLGSAFIDYIFADEFVAPPDQAKYYSEKIVYLPHSFQVNDRMRAVSEEAPSRAECGLPSDAFVFCCFNNSYKIGPAMFDIWMRLLRDSPNSVLWLSGRKDFVEHNLREEAKCRGVDPARLVFAQRCDDLADHLARHRQADLFLDTLPYNAHTTASDALWAGLPVLTCAGRGFAARVAGSVLHAMGLPDLVTGSLEEYETLARKLAASPDLMSALKTRLMHNRDVTPLFNSDLFCRHIEAAFDRMWTYHRNGEIPRSFHIDPG